MKYNEIFEGSERTLGNRHRFVEENLLHRLHTIRVVLWLETWPRWGLRPFPCHPSFVALLKSLPAASSFAVVKERTNRERSVFMDNAKSPLCWLLLRLVIVWWWFSTCQQRTICLYYDSRGYCKYLNKIGFW